MSPFGLARGEVREGLRAAANSKRPCFCPQASVCVFSAGEWKAEIAKRSILRSSEDRVQKPGLFFGTKLGESRQGPGHVKLQQQFPKSRGSVGDRFHVEGLA